MKALWVDRRFSFETPVALYPSLLERLRGTPARLEERVRGLDPETLQRRSGATWSIQENAGHLVSVEPLWLGRLDDFDAGRETLRAADMENKATRKADYHSRPLHEILDGFRAARAQVMARLEALDEAAAARSALHPRLNQPMRVIDMALFIAEHDDHHLARITELIREFGHRTSGSAGSPAGAVG